MKQHYLSGLIHKAKENQITAIKLAKIEHHGYYLRSMGIHFDAQDNRYAHLFGSWCNRIKTVSDLQRAIHYAIECGYNKMYLEGGRFDRYANCYEALHGGDYDPIEDYVWSIDIEC